MTGEDQIELLNIKRDMLFIFGDLLNPRPDIKGVWPETHCVLSDQDIMPMYKIGSGESCHYVGSRGWGCSLIRLEAEEVQERDAVTVG